MGLQGLTGQGLASQRFGFEGERDLGEECLDGGGPVLDGGEGCLMPGPPR